MDGLERPLRPLSKDDGYMRLVGSLGWRKGNGFVREFVGGWERDEFTQPYEL